eukprot:2416130-Pyramimonas_sp.AAC.1
MVAEGQTESQIPAPPGNAINNAKARVNDALVSAHWNIFGTNGPRTQHPSNRTECIPRQRTVFENRSRLTALKSERINAFIDFCKETLNTVKAAGKRLPNKENEVPSADAAKKRKTSTGSQGSVAASARPTSSRTRGASGTMGKIAEKKEEPEPPVRTPLGNKPTCCVDVADLGRAAGEPKPRDRGFVGEENSVQPSHGYQGPAGLFQRELRIFQVSIYPTITFGCPSPSLLMRGFRLKCTRIDSLHRIKLSFLTARPTFCRAYAKHISSTEATLLEERQQMEEKLAEEVCLVKKPRMRPQRHRVRCKMRQAKRQ